MWEMASVWARFCVRECGEGRCEGRAVQESEGAQVCGEGAGQGTPPKHLHTSTLPHPRADRDGHMVRSHRAVALNYLLGWFWIDLASSLPYDNITRNSQFAFLKLLRVSGYVYV